MTRRGVITVTTALVCIILGLLSPVPSALGSHMGKACCTGYNRKPVPFRLIKGYREQTTMENCRIEAIIFYTVQKIEICATRRDEWVRKILKSLSSKLKKMSKAGSAAGEIQTGKSVIPNGSGSFFNTAGTFPNSTESR